MILVLERRKGHSEYPFSSFSLLFLLAFDSINELVGVNGGLPCPGVGVPSFSFCSPPQAASKKRKKGFSGTPRTPPLTFYRNFRLNG